MIFSFPPVVVKLGELFDAENHVIRAVGGWVRDSLRGVQPEDLDLATTARPDEIIDICRANGLSYMDAGLKHGTVGIIINHEVYEVTTLRIDRATDGRHAEVEFTTDWEADAARRDFTINAMSVSLDGGLYDYFNGRDHLKDRRVVFVGDPEARIREDFLRLLRYYRFRGRIGHSDPDGKLLDTFIATAPGLRQISGERIWMEMSRILSGDMLLPLLTDMDRATILDHISIPKVDGADRWRAAAAATVTGNPITVLAALTTHPVADLWRLSRYDRLLLGFLQTHRDQHPTLTQLKEIATGKYGREFAIEYAAMFGPSNDLDDIRAWSVPTMPVRGADLIDSGMRAGPEIGRTLHLLDQRWKDSDYRLGKDELIASLYTED